MKPLFSDKFRIRNENVILVDNDIISSEGKEVAEIINIFFIEAVDSLCIHKYISHHDNEKEDEYTDDISIILDDYRQHPSIIKIKEFITVTETFDFGNLNSDDIKKEIKELNKILSEVFPQYNSSHDLRNNRSWITSNVRAVYYDKETLSFRGPKTWKLLPKSMQNIGTLKESKIRIKTWKPEGCTCRLCLIFIPSLGFLPESGL